MPGSGRPNPTALSITQSYNIDSYVFRWHAKGSPLSDDSSLDDDASHDWIPRIEDAVGQEPKLDGENRLVLELFALLTLQILLVSREAVE